MATYPGSTDGGRTTLELLKLESKLKLNCARWKEPLRAHSAKMAESNKHMMGEISQLREEWSEAKKQVEQQRTQFSQTREELIRDGKALKEQLLKDLHEDLFEGAEYQRKP